MSEVLPLVDAKVTEGRRLPGSKDSLQGLRLFGILGQGYVGWLSALRRGASPPSRTSAPPPRGGSALPEGPWLRLSVFEGFGTEKLKTTPSRTRKSGPQAHGRNSHTRPPIKALQSLSSYHNHQESSAASSSSFLLGSSVLGKDYSTR